MNGSSGANKNPADAFTSFWADAFGKLSGAAMSGGFGQSQEEMQKQMRQAFFDAWARHCDEFLRSEPFLNMMKQSMDNSLAFRKQLNEFMGQALEQTQMPSRGDTDSILQAVRRLEDRVLGRIEALTQRVEAMEGRGPDSARGAAESTKPRAKGATR